MAVVASPSIRPRLGLGRLLGINAFWFGGGAHWQPIYFTLLPVGAVLAAGKSADLLIGAATAAGAVFAAGVPIMAGWLSDRTVSRWGRRTPWIVAGTLINLVGLGLLAVAGSPLFLVAAVVLVQISNNAAGAAYSGVIPDMVSEEERGRASGLLGTMNQLGTVVGLAAVFFIATRFGDTRTTLVGGYAAVAVIMLVSLVITVRAVREPASRPSASARFDLRTLLAPFRNADFFWVFATRALVMIGIWSILPFMELYFKDVVGAEKAGAANALWGLTVLAGAVVPSIVAGYLSDHLHRRKIFVYISSGLQAAVVSVLLFGLIRSMPLLYLLGIIYGIGYGAYYAVDWALVCDVLPDREKNASKDMALWHTSLTLPQVLAPALLAPILHALNQPGHNIFGIATGGDLGFRFVFASAAIWFVLGTVMVTRVRGVR